MTQNDLQTLFSRQERPNISMLSVYLDVDQSRQANLNRKFETQLKDILSNIRKNIADAGELERFQTAARHVEDFVSVYKNACRGLALFFDATDGFFWHQEIGVPLDNQAHWDHEFFLRPIAELIDEFESFGVIVINHANWRVFSVSLGAVEEHLSRGFDPKKVRHIKATGPDHRGSANTVQRKADEQIRANLRRAIQDIDWLVQTQKVDHLVLAGAPDVTAELRNMLPKRLALRVMGRVDIKVDASAKEVFRAVRTLGKEHEREGESQIVKEVLTAAAKKQKAVTGLSRTLNAINQGRVWQLIYSERLSEPGFECRACAALFSAERESCHYCGGSVEPVRDVIERAVDHGLRHGAKVEVVRGEASAALKVAGGIGAFLKARTASALV